MPIVINIDVMMARRKMSLTELSQLMDMNINSLSILKTGNVKAIRFEMMDMLCKVLHCKPGDLFDYMTDEEYKKLKRL
jgi:putative transcriptional regulator